MTRFVKKHAFTLVEAIVTMVIIGSLISVAWPSWQSMLSYWRRGECLGNLHRIRTAKSAYAVDFLGGGFVNWKADPRIATNLFNTNLFKVYFVGSYPTNCPETKAAYVNMTDPYLESTCPTHGDGNWN